MNIKLQCLKCKQEREITEDELKEVKEFIEKKNRNFTTILKYMNLIDGEVCDEREHKYGFNLEFLNQITSEIENIKEIDNTITKNENEQTELFKQMEEISNKLSKLNGDIIKLKEEHNKKNSEIIESTGLEWTRWK